MAKLPTLKGIDVEFADLQAEFQKIFDSNEPENLPMPGRYNDLDYFQKMIILKSIRPDKVPFAVQNYVTEKIGR